jgi:methylenetetrahydrofolate/methylenetetrahydromethanopterin dehydrogenase (NADP+)
MNLPHILIQLDPDKHSSSFDAVVAVDSGVHHLLPYAGVSPSDVRDLVYGAIFTRGAKELKSTAIFIGGRDVTAGEALLSEVKRTFFGPLRVSVMLDANGANTTASAAVMALIRHVAPGQQLAVLAGTGSVGRRVARLAAGLGYHVRIASRTLDRAQQAAQQLIEFGQGQPDFTPPTPHAIQGANDLQRVLDGVDAIIAAGAPGAELIAMEQRPWAATAKVLIDLNAVPPVGIAGIDVLAHQVEHEGQFHYGAIGVGGIKMRLHRACLQRLFTDNRLVLDAEQILQVGRQLSAN